jgi:hypothetical protein
VRGIEAPLEAGKARGKCWRQIRRKGRRERSFVMEMRWQVYVSQGVSDHSESQDTTLPSQSHLLQLKANRYCHAPHCHPIRPYKVSMKC